MTVPPHSPPPSEESARPGREQTIGAGLRWLSTWSVRWLAIALAAVALGFVVQYAWSIIFPVVLALILTTVLERPARFLERRAHLPPALASAVVLLGGIAALVAIAFAVAPSVSGQSSDIVDSASDGLQKVQDWVQKSDFVTRGQVDAAIQAAQDRIQSSGSAIASGVLTTVSAITSAVVTLVITLILTFLFLKDGRRFVPWARRLGGARAGEHVGEVLDRSWATLGGFIRTQALVSAIDAVFIGLGLVLVGVPLAVPLAILTFFGGFVPIVGAVVVGILAVLVALVSNGFTGALIILAVILAVQQLEGNVLSPWLQSKSMKLHPAVVLLAVALGSTLFGITGAFLAVPAVAVAAVVLRYLDEQVSVVTGEPPPEEHREDDPQDDPQDDPDGDDDRAESAAPS